MLTHQRGDEKIIRGFTRRLISAWSMARVIEGCIAAQETDKGRSAECTELSRGSTDTHVPRQRNTRVSCRGNRQVFQHYRDTVTSHRAPHVPRNQHLRNASASRSKRKKEKEARLFPARQASRTGFGETVSMYGITWPAVLPSGYYSRRTMDP